MENSPSQLNSGTLSELLEMVWRGRIASALLEEGSDPDRVFGLVTTTERGAEAREQVLEMWHPHIKALLDNEDPIDDLISYQYAVTALIELMSTYEPNESSRPIVDVIYETVTEAIPGKQPALHSTSTTTSPRRGRCRIHR